MGELNVHELRGTAAGGQLRVHELAGSLTSTTQLRLVKLSGTATASTAASAGEDRTGIEPGATVTLDGSATLGGSTFQWTCISYGTTGAPSITNATSAIASYTAPSEFADVPLVFRLTVDGTTTDDVTHHVAPQIEWRYDGSDWLPCAY